MSVNDLQTTVEHLWMTCGQPLNVRERSSDVHEQLLDVCEQLLDVHEQLLNVREQSSDVHKQPSSVCKQPSNVCRQILKVSHNSQQSLMNPDNSRMSETKVRLSGQRSMKVWTTVNGGDSHLGTCRKLAQSVPFLQWLILVHSEQHTTQAQCRRNLWGPLRCWGVLCQASWTSSGENKNYEDNVSGGGPFFSILEPNHQLVDGLQRFWPLATESAYSWSFFVVRFKCKLQAQV